jgi:molybdopterin-guanine dinucleotide biosynthesis protein B
MVKLLAIVGCKKSGKTSVISRLIEVFSEKGYRVGVIKNSHHSITLDQPGTDTWRFREAGATRIMLACPEKALLPHFSIQQNEKPQYLAELCMDDLDLVLLEGFKNSPLHKILLHSRKENIEFNRRGLIATVGGGTTIEDLPDFDRDDIESIAAFIEERFLKPEGRNVMDIKIRVDGRKIGLKGFVKNMLSNAIVGMISTLKGCKDAKKIEIIVDLEAEETEEDQ